MIVLVYLGSASSVTVLTCFIASVTWMQNTFCFTVFLLLRLKGDLAYNYKGPRTRDDIVEFANRVAG